MKSPDDFSDLYGPTIDSTPNYTNDEQRNALRPIFWDGDDINPKLEALLVETACKAMKTALERELPSLTDYAITAEVSLISDEYDDGYYEWFSTEVNVHFDFDDYDDVAETVESAAVEKILIAAVDAAFSAYISQSGVAVGNFAIRHEITEAGGS